MFDLNFTFPSSGMEMPLGALKEYLEVKPIVFLVELVSDSSVPVVAVNFSATDLPEKFKIDRYQRVMICGLGAVEQEILVQVAVFLYLVAVAGAGGEDFDKFIQQGFDQGKSFELLYSDTQIRPAGGHLFVTGALFNEIAADIPLELDIGGNSTEQRETGGKVITFRFTGGLRPHLIAQRNIGLVMET